MEASTLCFVIIVQNTKLKQESQSDNWGAYWFEMNENAPPQLARFLSCLLLFLSHDICISLFPLLQTSSLVASFFSTSLGLGYRCLLLGILGSS